LLNYNRLEKNIETKIILPDAAGVIALTALLGFVDGASTNENDRISRKSIRLVCGLTGIDQRFDSVLQRHKINASNPAYAIQIKIGETISEILINAKTGKVLT